VKSWQRKAGAHARAEYDAGRLEACGLVVERGERQMYVPCVNGHETPHSDFRIAAQEYAAAEEWGRIVAVFHSHPDESCHPSIGDQVACEASGLPWYILGLPDGKWGHCAPCGFELPYEGRPFVHGIIDCYSLIRDWYKRERSIELPDFQRRDNWWKPDENGRCQDLYVENFTAAGFRKIEAAQARDGDVILMQVSAPRTNHGAILVNAAANHILHHVHDRLSETVVYGGYWRDWTTHILRHRQCEK
jgi:proteasome lid subunit RPN8/RPN11